MCEPLSPNNHVMIHNIYKEVVGEDDSYYCRHAAGVILPFLFFLFRRYFNCPRNQHLLVPIKGSLGGWVGGLPL